MDILLIKTMRYFARKKLENLEEDEYLPLSMRFALGWTFFLFLLKLIIIFISLRVNLNIQLLWLGVISLVTSTVKTGCEVVLMMTLYIFLPYSCLIWLCGFDSKDILFDSHLIALLSLIYKKRITALTMNLALIILTFLLLL